MRSRCTVEFCSVPFEAVYQLPSSSWPSTVVVAQPFFMESVSLKNYSTQLVLFLVLKNNCIIQYFKVIVKIVFDYKSDKCQITSWRTLNARPTQLSNKIWTWIARLIAFSWSLRINFVWFWFKMIWLKYTSILVRVHTLVNADLVLYVRWRASSGDNANRCASCINSTLRWTV